MHDVVLCSLHVPASEDSRKGWKTEDVCRGVERVSWRRAREKAEEGACGRGWCERLPASSIGSSSQPGVGFESLLTDGCVPCEVQKKFWAELRCGLSNGSSASLHWFSSRISPFYIISALCTSVFPLYIPSCLYLHISKPLWSYIH